MDVLSYQKWKMHIDECGHQLKLMSSNESNDTFDHLYKMDGLFEKFLTKMATNTKTIMNSVCIPCYENQMVQMMTDEFELPNEPMNEFANSSSSSKNNDSGFISTDDGNESRRLENINEKKGKGKRPNKRKRPEVEIIDEVGTVEITLSQIEKIVKEKGE